MKAAAAWLIVMIQGYGMILRLRLESGELTPDDYAKLLESIKSIDLVLRDKDGGIIDRHTC